MSAVSRIKLGRRGGIASVILGGWLLLTAWAAIGQQTRTSENPEGKWEVLEGCILSTNSISDGDSFQVEHKGRTYIFRIYFVDAPESDASLTDRITDQAAYFGLSPADVARGGKLAGEFTRDKLSGREFTVVTRWQNAMGRSTLARFYGIALVQGKNLSEELVAAGFARIYGLRANWPEGTRSTTTINKLKNLEMQAREQRRGLWDEKGFSRQTDRAATPATAKVGKAVTAPMDLNEANYEELQTLPGIGPKLAERIVASRPFHKVDDLLKVGGIGTQILERIRPLVRVEGIDGEK
ncbi:MAG: helix-hairpin-helix domain-containing protein [Opitutaceae bacterium]|nr:helix-hairpin-helix domain-containing protein [Verrucomicrobiales bacterium]